jgi:hypothetical protein
MNGAMYGEQLALLTQSIHLRRKRPDAVFSLDQLDSNRRRVLSILGSCSWPYLSNTRESSTDSASLAGPLIKNRFCAESLASDSTTKGSRSNV